MRSRARRCASTAIVRPSRPASSADARGCSSTHRRAADIRNATAPGAGIAGNAGGRHRPENMTAGCCPAAPRAEECLRYRDVEVGPCAIASPASHARDDQCKARGRLIPAADLMSEIVPDTFSGFSCQFQHWRRSRRQSTHMLIHKLLNLWVLTSIRT